jgi:hypothetical protein
MGRVFIGILLMGILSACSPMRVTDFSGRGETFDLFGYFSGTTHGYGLFEDRFGTIKRQFKVVIEGSIDGDKITLDEDFLYDDGETQKRVWTITRRTDGSYEGRADDVIGVARGKEAGNALNWAYTLALPVGGRVFEVQFDDWMLRQQDGVVINRAKVRKFGFDVGSVTLAFTKP